MDWLIDLIGLQNKDKIYFNFICIQNWLKHIDWLIDLNNWIKSNKNNKKIYFNFKFIQIWFKSIAIKTFLYVFHM